MRRIAAGDKDARFTALLHHVDVDRLRAAYWALKPKAAAGVDGNIDADHAFRSQATRHWYRALRRRSQRTRLDWKRMHRLATHGSRLPAWCIPSPTSASTPEPEAGAQCVSSARWDLRGGPLAKAVPTAIARESTLAVSDQATGEVLTRRVVGRPHELLPVLREIPRPARMVYEAGPTGYGLARRGRAEGLEVAVCAPGKTDRPPCPGRGRARRARSHRPVRTHDRAAPVSARDHPLTAFGLSAEIGEWESFDHPDQLAAYLGIVPCEHTTGAQRRLGSIT